MSSDFEQKKGTLHWFETELLAPEENFTGLVELNGELVARAEGVGSSSRVVLHTLGAGSLCPVREKRTMRKPEAKSGL